MDGGAPLKPRSALARFEIPIAITVEYPNALNPPLTHGRPRRAVSTIWVQGVCYSGTHSRSKPPSEEPRTVHEGLATITARKRRRRATLQWLL